MSIHGLVPVDKQALNLSVLVALHMLLSSLILGGQLTHKKIYLGPHKPKVGWNR